MKINFGNHNFDISEIVSAEIKKADSNDLFEIVSHNNEIDIELFSEEYQLSIWKVFRHFKTLIIKRLPDPLLNAENLIIYKGGYGSEIKIIDDLHKWSTYCLYDSRFVLQGSNENINACVLWRFKIWKGNSRSITNVEQIITFEHMIEIFKELIDLPWINSRWKRFWSDYSYEDVQKEIRPVYDEYIKKKILISQFEQTKAEFFEKYRNAKILIIEYVDGTYKKYLENRCGFDIELALKSINNELENEEINFKRQEKLKNSNNEGEKTVNYAIEWFIKSNQDKKIVAINGDCESKYRLDCILLNKPDFIDDPQEYDHILVCPAGIILIETKHWKGTVEIRNDGQWIRENEGEKIGVENPKFQMHRHELMMQKIAPNIKTYSLLCFSNGKIIINGKDNFTGYPITTIDQLEEKLFEICSVNLYTENDIENIVDIINDHKVNIQ